MSIWIGCDPGGKGACTALRSDGKMRICRFDKATEQDIWKFLESLAEKASWDNEPIYAMIEHIHAMPAFIGAGRGGPEAGTGMRGSIASLKIGQSYGFLRGLLIASGISFEEVRAQVWQKALGCLTKGDKRVSKARAEQLFPNVKVIHVTADSLLIATYCKRTIIKREGGQQ